MVEGNILSEKKNAEVYTDLVMKIQNCETNEENLDIICARFVDDIIKREKSLTELVEYLECLLTSPELTKHNVGIDVLARVLQGLPKDFLNSTELDLITQFFCSQVKQHHSFLSSSLKGMLSLTQNVQLTQSSLHDITSALFNNVVWQTQPLTDRRNLYHILQYITYNRIEDYRSTSSEFLFSIITSVDGERDPRNLLLLFSFLPQLYMSVPLGALVEDAFEAVSCYFPIDFHSASSNPDAVTRENLVEALTPCLLAAPEFSKFCFPLIQEKLDSTLKAAKIDSYNLVREGCVVWEAGYIVPHLEWLWKAITQDTLPPRDTQIADCATQALQALVRAIPEDNLTSLLNNILRTCEMFLTNAQLSLFEPSSRLLLATMEASSHACRTLSHQLLPKLVSLVQVTQGSSKVLVLNKLITFIGACLNNKIDFHSEAEGWRGLQEEVLASMQTGGPEVKQAALEVLTELTPYLGADIRTSLYSRLLGLLTTQQLASLRNVCIKCLQSLTRIYENEVQSNIIEHLIIKDEQAEDLALNELQFGAVCNLAVVESLHPLLEDQFVRLITRGDLSTTVAITCLRTLLENDDIQQNNSLLNFLFAQSSLLRIFIGAKINESHLLDVAKIIQILVRLQFSREQERIVAPLIKDCLNHHSQLHQIILLEAFICPLWPDVSILKTNLQDISNVVISAATSPLENTLLIDSGLRLLSILINKTGDAKLIELASGHLHEVSKQRAITIHAYITKALCSRGHPTMEHWVNKLVDLLDEEEGGEIAADGIRLVVDKADEWLSLKNHCEVRLLYHQRLYSMICPRLVCSNRNMQNLKALAYLMQSVPRSVYENSIGEIVPLLMLSLDMDSEQLLHTVLSTMTSLLSSDNRVLLESHVDTFIPRFLNLSRNCQFMKVRIAALKCLSNTLKCSPAVILPHKHKVISDLVPCLDDKKRLVRKEAAVTRSKWFLLGAPTADP